MVFEDCANIFKNSVVKQPYRLFKDSQGFLFDTKLCFAIMLIHERHKTRATVSYSSRVFHYLSTCAVVVLQQPWQRPEPISPPLLWMSSPPSLRSWHRSLWWRRSNQHWGMLSRWVLPSELKCLFKEKNTVEPVGVSFCIAFPLCKASNRVGSNWLVGLELIYGFASPVQLCDLTEPLR